MGTRRSPEGADLEMIATIPHLLGAVYVEAATGLRVSWPTPQKCPTRLSLQPTKLTHNKGGISMSGVHTKWDIQQGLTDEPFSGSATTRNWQSSSTQPRCCIEYSPLRRRAGETIQTRILWQRKLETDNGVRGRVDGRVISGHHEFDIKPTVYFNPAGG